MRLCQRGAGIQYNYSLERVWLEEKGYDAVGRCIVSVDARYFYPTEVRN